MKKNIPLLVLLAFAFCACGGGGGGGSDSQPPPPTINHWAKLFGRTGFNSEARAIQQTNDGGFITVGQTGLSTPGTGDILVIRTDDKGNILWKYSYDTGTSDDAFSIATSSDNGFVLHSIYEAYKPYLIKIDSNGTIIWSKGYTVPPNPIYPVWQTGNIIKTKDNGYIVCGQIPQASPSSDYDGFVIKLDSNGNNVWQKKYIGVGGLSFGHIEQTLDNGYIVTGIKRSPPPIQIVLLKLDSLGNITWQKSYGGTFGDYGKFVKQTRDGGFILLCSILSYSLGNNYDIWVVKLDNSGNIQWQKVFAGALYDEGEAIEQTSDDGYIITGHGQSFVSPLSRGWVFKLNTNGNTEWQRVYNGNYLYDIHQTNDQGYIVAGKTFDNVQNNVNNYWILKLETNGSCSPIDTSINVSANTFTPNILMTGYVPVDISMNVSSVNVLRSSPIVDVIQQAP